LTSIDSCVAKRFFSVNLKVLTQGNLSGIREDPARLTIGGYCWQKKKHLFPGYCLLLCGSSLSDYNS